MKKILVLFSIVLLASSCIKQMEEPESAKIAGMWAAVDENGFTNKYISFEYGYIAEEVSRNNKTFYVADKSVWACTEDSFRPLSSQPYSVVDGILSYDNYHHMMLVDGDAMILGDITYSRIEDFRSEYYSTINISNPLVTFAFNGGNVEWPYTIANPVDGFVLTVKAPDWVKNVRVTGDKIYFTVPETSSIRTGNITISYPSAEERSLSITQKAAEINLEKTSVTLGYFASSSSFTYSIPNPQSGYALSVETTADWITNVKDNGSSISFSVAENNSGASRTGKITLSYGGVSKVFTVTQTYSASSISLTPTSGSHDYTSGTYTFKYTVSNPREGQRATVTSSDSWITSVIDSNGTVSYMVTENNSGSARTGTITVAYAGVNKVFSIIQMDIPEDLSVNGTANCYVVSSAGSYYFKQVKGNSSTSVGTVSSVAVLWESFGTSITPSVGDLIKSVSYMNGNIYFDTAAIFKEGNAVIAAKDASGKILWSWHIWLTDQPQEQVYYNGAGTMMDRNLGAASATPGDVGALGLLYQWGRKDPFLGSSSISSSVEAKSTITWPSNVLSNSSNGTIAYATAHPTTFITYDNSSNGDWYYTGSKSTDNTRWTTSESTKSIYDPCPAGWRVPDGGSNGVWSKALGSSSEIDYTYNSANEGMNFSGKFGSASTIWYPASGYRHYYAGSLSNVGGLGYYWSASPYKFYAYCLFFGNDGSVGPSDDFYYRASGMSVRCLRESN